MEQQPLSDKDILANIDREASSLERDNQTGHHFVTLRDFYEDKGDHESAECVQWDIWAWASYWISEANDRKKQKRWYKDSNWPLPPKANDHFRQRLNTFSNPHLRARYGTLLWQRQRQRDHLAARIAVEAHLEVASGLLLAEPTSAEERREFKRFPWLDLHTHLDTALEISLQLNDNDLSQRVKTASMKSLQAILEKGRYRYLIEICGTLVMHPRILDEGELDQLENFIEDGVGGLVECPEESFQLERHLRDHLIKLRRFRKVPEAKLRDLYAMQAESFMREAQFKLNNYPSPHLVAAHFLRRAQELYGSLGERDRVRQLEREIQNHMEQAMTTEMAVHTMEIEIDFTKFDPWVDRLLEMGITEALDSMGLDQGLLPHIASAEKVAAGTLEEHPILGILPMQHVRGDRLIRTSITYKEHKDANFKQQVTWELNFWLSSALQRAFRRLKEKGTLTQDRMLEYLTSSPFLANRDNEIVRRGIERYFAGDFISCLHILVPQFEDAFRNLLPRFGITVTKTEQGKTQKRLLNDLLGDDNVVQLLSPPLYWYIHLLLNSEDGLNLRHDIAHGLITPRACAEWSCTLVLHLFIIFGAISKKALGQ